MSRRRLIALLILLVFATGSGYVGWRLSRIAPIGTAYAAKILCSEVFVARRAPQPVIAEDIVADNIWLLRLVHAQVDRARQRASATFLGLARREAQFRPGLGCTLALGPHLEPVRPVPTVQDTEDILPVAAAAPDVNRETLSAALDWAFDEPDPQRPRRTRAVVVVHHGQIIAERYASGFSADTPLSGWSMTKTVAAVLAGMLVGDRRLTLDSHPLLVEWQSAGDERADITLNELLRMTDGLEFNERYSDPLSDVVVMLLGTGDASGFALRKPLATSPGTIWRYSSGTTNVLARVLRRTQKDRDLSGYLRHRLFDALGMRHAVIEPDAAGTPVLSSFMHATAREWAALGEFLLQDGVWHGKRLLPAGWVDYMRTPTPQSSRGDFGANLWLKVPLSFGGTGPAAATLPADAFHLSGYEAQMVSIVPSRDLVVVRLGLSRLPHTWDQAVFLSRVLQAISGPGSQIGPSPQASLGSDPRHLGSRGGDKLERSQAVGPG